MKMMIVVALALVAAVCAGPVPADKETTIVQETYNRDPQGPYNFKVETSDGSSKQETGELKTVTDAENKPQTVIVVRGSFSYVNDKGEVETINYEADENGYRAEGPSVPRA